MLKIGIVIYTIIYFCSFGGVLYILIDMRKNAPFLTKSENVIVILLDIILLILCIILYCFTILKMFGGLL